jgi:hypothetical protein
MKRTNYLASQAGTCPEPPLKKVRGRLRRSGALNNWFDSICFFAAPAVLATPLLPKVLKILR